MSRLSDLLKKAKERTNPIAMPIAESTYVEVENAANAIHYGIDRYGKQIQWNTEQWTFIQNCLNGKSGVLIGAAGTGKTTTIQGTIQEILNKKHIPLMNNSHKHLPIGTPGIVFVSYTRRAVMNLKKALPEDLKSNCITIHKLLEYAPVFYEINDPVTNETRNTMRFEPSRGPYKHLDSNIKIIVFDESSMVDVPLFHKVWSALPDPMNVQFLFLGDIQQLPPIFGSAILGFKMISLPVVELTQVYRQALESPIIRLAHRILSGNPIPAAEFNEWKFKDQLTIHPWKKRISADSALLTIAAFFKAGFNSGAYNPMEDMILIPFNKACGTIELNKHIGNHIARKNKRLTHEIIAGFNKHYFSEGEKVLYEKEDAEIISIKRNPTYTGKWPQAANDHLDYWGTIQSENSDSEHHIEAEQTEDEIDEMLLRIGSADDEDRVNEASHIITVRLLDSSTLVEIKTAGDVNALLMAYALTIHKSQGSEWRRVFLIMHQSHNTMIQRELLYTGVTRAREELYCICEPDHFIKGIDGQRIKGNSLIEKSEFFKGKIANGENDLITMMNDSTGDGK